MVEISLKDKKIYIEGHPVNDTHIEAILKKGLPGVHITFIDDDDEFAICEMNGKSVSIANMIFLKDGEFESIAEWEKACRRTIKHISSKLSPLAIETKKSDLL